MTLNAIVTACNQKSNRHPAMSLGPEEVEESLERLRNVGAVGLVQGVGRAAKYRHYLYEWLGVDKVELAVMTELLLRGPQTEGDLRARAARMEPIADLSALRPVVTALKTRGLVVPLTPEGRGLVVTHNLYPPREMEKLRAQAASLGVGAFAPAEETEDSSGGAAAAPAAPAPTAAVADQLPREVAQLRAELAQVRGDVDDLRAALRRTEDDLHRLRQDLGAG
jgi:uncharacterized protein YceH (UPF0502 family)